MTSRSDRSSRSTERAWAARGGDSSRAAQVAVERAHRTSWGRLLSLLVARSRRLDLAEDALGEAFARASARWPLDGVPDDPDGWLYTTAWRQILGALRAEATHGRIEQRIAVSADWLAEADAVTVPDGLESVGDERLAVLLLCCHPAVHSHARAPLALRLGVGTSTAEIARLFLVSTPTMAARLTRAKKKIVAAGIPLSRPVEEELRDRVRHLCQAIYVAFTAGYSPGEGPDLLRAELAGEAVELAIVLRSLVPELVEPRALLALLLLQHARRDARVADGRLVPLAEQDRSLWRRDELGAGLDLVATIPVSDGYADELRLQALIAAEHARAGDAAATDWPAIARCYRRLDALTGSPVVRLNRAVAEAEADGPHAGLRLLDELDSLLDANHRFHAVRAELLLRSGDHAAARNAFDAAIARCDNGVERTFLADRRATLTD